MALYAARLSAMLWLEAHETIWNCGLVYYIDREKLYQPILWQEFIENIASDQILISGKKLFQITLALLQQKAIVFS